MDGNRKLTKMHWGKCMQVHLSAYPRMPPSFHKDSRDSFMISNISSTHKSQYKILVPCRCTDSQIHKLSVPEKGVYKIMPLSLENAECKVI
jgi:hypothetical protein